MFDAYTRNARLVPAGLVIIPPLVLAGGGFLITPIDAASPLGLVLIAVGVVGSVIARARGRTLEPGLWDRWGGSPTVSRLRWRDSTDFARTQRLHTRVQGIADVPLPTREEEQRDPATADLRYEESTLALRELTRSADFPLVAAANMDYGFRRNTLGLRPIGLAVSVGTAVASGELLADTGKSTLIVPLVVGLVAVGLWLLVSEAWVHTAADDYAERLFGAVTLLAGPVERSRT